MLFCPGCWTQNLYLVRRKGEDLTSFHNRLLWSGLVSQVGASHRVNLIVLFPLGQNCPRTVVYVYVIQKLEYRIHLQESLNESM